MQKHKVQDQRRKRLAHMDSSSKSKMLHSTINKDNEGGEVRCGLASEATMNSEGRSAHAKGGGQTTKLLVAYTSFVSMDSTNKETSNKMDYRVKRGVQSFTKDSSIQDVFD